MTSIYEQLILALIAVAPGIVTSLENWFVKNPRLPDETDDAYAARINQQTRGMAADTTATDAQVVDDDAVDGGNPIVQSPKA